MKKLYFLTISAMFIALTMVFTVGCSEDNPVNPVNPVERIVETHYIDTTIFLCEPDTVSICLRGVPIGVTDIVMDSMIHNWWINENVDSLYFYLPNKNGDSSADLTCDVRLISNTLICDLTYDIHLSYNQPPTISLPADTTISSFFEEKLYIPIDIGDDIDSLPHLQTCLTFSTASSTSPTYCTDRNLDAAAYRLIMGSRLDGGLPPQRVRYINFWWYKRLLTGPVDVQIVVTATDHECYAKAVDTMIIHVLQPIDY